MESIFTELALYGSINECARTDTVFLPISLMVRFLLQSLPTKSLNQSLNECVRAYFVQLEKLSSFIQTKWTKLAVAY